MGAKIMLVTESEDIDSKLRMSLHLRGHDVHTVKALAKAHEALKSDSTIDLVICDLIFMSGNGFDLLKDIRADHALSSLPFVFALTKPQVLTESVRTAAGILGADKFIFTDEFDPHRIRCEIEALLPEQLSSLPQPHDGYSQPDSGTRL